MSTALAKCVGLRQVWGCALGTLIHDCVSDFTFNGQWHTYVHVHGIPNEQRTVYCHVNKCGFKFTYALRQKHICLEHSSGRRVQMCHDVVVQGHYILHKTQTKTKL